MKQFLIKLKRSLWYNDTLKASSKYVYLITLGIIIFLWLIFHFNIIYLLLLIVFLLVVFINIPSLLVIILIAYGILGLNILIRKINYNKTPYTNVIIECIVISTKKTAKSNQVVVRSKNVKYQYYDPKNKYQVGDIIKVEGTLIKESKKHAPMLFDYQDYLEKNNIRGTIKIEKTSYIKKGFTLYSINNTLQNYFNSRFPPQTAGFLEALLIGHKNNLGEENQRKIQNIGISHLFVISGLHMGVLSLIIKKLLGLLKIPEKHHFKIITPFFIGYYIISAFSISILRVLLIYIFSYLNKKYLHIFSTFNIYNLVIAMILLINPYYISSYAFGLTFIISTSLVLINPLLKYKGIKGFFINNIIISLNSLIVTLPIVITINPQINFLSIIYNLFYIPFVSYILLPFSIIVCALPFLSNIYATVINLFMGLTTNLANINFGRMTFSSVSILLPITFYFLYVMYIKNKLQKKKQSLRWLGLILGLVLIWNNTIWFKTKDEVIFLDLPRGEATLISSSHNKCNILIDTGENSGTDLETFLKKKGIKRIDYLFISHGDSDHNGKIETLIKEFRIKNIVVTPYDKTSIKKCQSAAYKGNLHYFKRGSMLSKGNLKIKCLYPAKDAKDTNNNSMVLNVDYFNTTFLFTGDIEKKSEMELFTLERKIKVDFLKVPHHGSLTSSSSYLQELVDYKYAICMNGYQNTFSFPNNIIRKSYEHKAFLVTSEKSSIILKKKLFKKEFKIT
ncbi:MAG: DNA internalization-related competence protein ComEC/Rec2 [Bacilli bacterium]|nr:DNA internalization-related competence protein ComEC/Rec2 [Bacilli bacterium]